MTQTNKTQSLDRQKTPVSWAGWVTEEGRQYALRVQFLDCLTTVAIAAYADLLSLRHSFGRELPGSPFEHRGSPVSLACATEQPYCLPWAIASSHPALRIRQAAAVVLAWASRYHLAFDWLLPVAWFHFLSTPWIRSRPGVLISEMLEQPEFFHGWGGTFQLFYLNPDRHGPPKPSPAPQLPAAWDPLTESKSDYRSRCRAYEKAIEKALRATAKSAGWFRNPMHKDERIVYAIRHRVLEESPRHIALSEDPSLAEGTEANERGNTRLMLATGRVAELIERLEKDMGIASRPSKRGPQPRGHSAARRRS
jgi:hypothetical protein